MNKIFRCIAIYLFLLFAYSNSKAQTNCGWQQGDIVTYTQATWGNDGSSIVAILLDNNFGAVYGNNFQFGISGTNGYSLLFTNTTNLLAYLPANQQHVFI